MENKRIKLSDIVRNEGQVAGLPSNPRQWTKRELEQLKKSLKETPELLEARGILVYPHEGKYIILGGNMRYTALSEMKEKDAPCIVVDPDTPADKLRELVVKDNGTFGEWDFDALANEWDDLPLTDWGVPAWEAIEGDDTLADIDLSIPHDMSGKKDETYSSMTFVFLTEQIGIVKDWCGQHSKEELSAKIVELCRNVEVK